MLGFLADVRRQIPRKCPTEGIHGGCHGEEFTTLSLMLSLLGVGWCVESSQRSPGAGAPSRDSGGRWGRLAPLRQGAVAQPLKTTWTGGKMELAGMRGWAGEGLKGDLGD